MIFKKNKFFLHSLRVLYQGENLRELLDKNKYDYITVISYNDLSLEKEGYGLVRKKLANIHLGGTIEEILDRFARRTRQEVLGTYKISNLEFRLANDDLKKTYNLYKEFERAQGRKPWKIDSFQNTLLFNAYYKDELIASVPCYDLFPYLQVRAMCSKRMGMGERNKELYKLIGSATRRLIFEICKYAKEKGYEFVGLGSINYSTPQKANVANFKMFFGSREGEEYTYVFKSRRFIALDRIRKFLNILPKRRPV
ncbi:MAG: hypothetical protein HYY86_00840 [Candidatus Harrisonbacteria bacterium]|nr:hypothetical protein [Candidatus Harrisonbacteria bacterium]